MTLTVLLPEEDAEVARRHLPDSDLVTYRPGQPVSDRMRAARVLVAGHGSTARESAALLAELPGIEFVQTLGAGYEQWAGQLPPGVALCNARGAHGGSTAEWAAAGLLAIYRDLPTFVADQGSSRWSPHTTDTLDGARVLVLGAGDLADNLQARLEPFGAHVTLVGRRARGEIHGRNELPALLPDSDAVVVMVPLDDSTRSIVDATFLAGLPDRAVVVNAGRGPLVDTEALVAELRSGRLRAALDVTDPEPLPAGHPLWDCPGLLITPHVGGNTRGSDDRAWAVVARHVTKIARGEQPDDIVEQD